MNKMIARRNGFVKAVHSRQNRKLVREMNLQRWWEKTNGRDVGLFKFWSRQEKKQFLLPGTDAYDKWRARFFTRQALDPQINVICGRHVIAPQDTCWSADRKLKISLVKRNAQGRRRKF
jgi:hypothetical protein